MMPGEARSSIRQRLRPERRAKSRRESERGWGPASIDIGDGA